MKFISRMILTLACLAATSWAYWYGTVYHNEVGIQGAKVIFFNESGQKVDSVFTAHGGGWQMSLPENTAVHCIYAVVYPSGEGVHTGINYVGQTYHSDTPITGLDIDVTPGWADISWDK